MVKHNFYEKVVFFSMNNVQRQRIIWDKSSVVRYITTNVLNVLLVLLCFSKTMKFISSYVMTYFFLHLTRTAFIALLVMQSYLSWVVKHHSVSPGNLTCTHVHLPPQDLMAILRKNGSNQERSRMQGSLSQGKLIFGVFFIGSLYKKSLRF